MMKKMIIFFTALCCIAVAGCSQDDPLEKLGSLPEDRITPSGISEILCSVECWKLTCDGHDFYFAFSSDGTVYTNSDVAGKLSVTTTYSTEWNGFHAVTLNINGGHFTSETSFTIEEDAYSENRIVASGVTTAQEYVFTDATEAEYAAMLQKDADLATVIEAIENISALDIVSGLLRDNSGSFIAHYFVVADKETPKVRFDVISDRVLTHTFVNLDVDKNASAVLETPFELAGQTITSLDFDLENDALALTGTSLSATTNVGVAEWFIGKDTGFPTYQMRGDGKGDACDAIWNEISGNANEWDQIEVSDRENRPLFFCPANGNDGKHYVGIYANGPSKGQLSISDTEKDVVLFTAGVWGEMPYGGDTKWVSAITGSQYPNLISAWSAADGMIIVKDGDNTLYLISPSSSDWFKAVR